MPETNLVRLLAASLTHARAERAQREAEVSTQDAPSGLPLTPQSDAEGSGVARDVQEALGAQTGAQGAEKCRCGHDGKHHTWRGTGCELCLGCDSFEDAPRLRYHGTVQAPDGSVVHLIERTDDA